MSNLIGSHQQVQNEIIFGNLIFVNVDQHLFQYFRFNVLQFDPVLIFFLHVRVKHGVEELWAFREIDFVDFEFLITSDQSHVRIFSTKHFCFHGWQSFRSIFIRIWQNSFNLKNKIIIISASWKITKYFQYTSNFTTKYSGMNMFLLFQDKLFFLQISPVFQRSEIESYWKSVIFMWLFSNTTISQEPLPKIASFGLFRHCNDNEI